jgi:hypothetical protein
MKWLALEHDLPGASSDQFAPLLRAEAAQVWALAAGHTRHPATAMAGEPPAAAQARSEF